MTMPLFRQMPNGRQPGFGTGPHPMLSKKRRGLNCVEKNGVSPEWCKGVWRERHLLCTDSVGQVGEVVSCLHHLSQVWRVWS